MAADKLFFCLHVNKPYEQKNNLVAAILQYIEWEPDCITM